MGRSITVSFFIFSCFLFFCTNNVHAQDKVELKNSATMGTLPKLSEINKVKKSSKQRVIYTKKFNKHLYGNPCVLEETRKMKFEYVIEPNRPVSSQTKAEKWINNFKVKSGLFFRRSPLWSIILRKRIEKCRVMMGDFIG